MVKLFAACVMMLSFLNPVATQAATAGSASETVDRFQSVLISTMKDAQKLGYEGRYKRLKPAIEESHNLPQIAKIVSGRFADQLKDEQKQQFTELFGELSIATYAAQFDGYSGELFKTVSERKLDNGSVVVQSVLTHDGDQKTTFDYVLTQKDGRWRIVNVVVDGVSDLAVKRSEYATILRTEGAEALIAKLKDKIAQYSKDPKKVAG